MAPPLNINSEGEWFGDLLTEVPSIDNGGLVLDEDGDGFTVNITMKDGLMWSDGTRSTLHDFKALYDWALQVAEANVGLHPVPRSGRPLIDPTLDGPGSAATRRRTCTSNRSRWPTTASRRDPFQKNFSGWMRSFPAAHQPEALLGARAARRSCEPHAVGTTRCSRSRRTVRSS